MIGNMIRKLRKEKMLKVYELANAVGVNPVYITQIEKHNTLPSWNIIKKISAILQKYEILGIYLMCKYPEIENVTVYGKEMSVNKLIK